MSIHRYLAVATLLILFSPPAAAVELGDISVGSHLGMPFKATVPLSLSAGEAAAELSIGLASPIDYRTLGVHRNPAINAIKADLVSDPRGNRIELSSLSPVETPYFTLVLKVQYRHATHFRRYPVTLDSPFSGRSAKRVDAAPAVVAGPAEKIEAQPPLPPANQTEPDQTATEQTETELAGADRATAVEAAAPPFRPFDGWARTARYGPTVQGDMLRVIADRLRLDERYTVKQVMVALYEKNRSNFAEENLNLPLPGSYFDVPTAAEVASLDDAQAAAMVAEHNRRWQELKKQPRYAAIAEAQKRRYSRHAPDGGDE